MANMAQAIRMALHVGETQLGVTDIFGEDVGAPLGGVFTATQGLKRAWNSPLDERGIIGAAMGIALAGGKPVAEIQFCDYIFNTIDLLKLAGNSCWSSNGAFPLNLTVMTPSGAGIHGSLYHSHSFDAIASHLAGWKVVLPSTPLDAYGLMLSAISDPNPVLFMAPKALMRVRGDELIPGEPADEKELRDRIDAPVGDRAHWTPRWPDLELSYVPIGQARTVRSGQHAVVVTYGRYVQLAKAVADKLAHEGVGEVEVIDLRTIYPYDWNAISSAVRRTGRVLFLNEDSEITNFGEHLMRRVVEEHFYELRARPRLLAGIHVPGIGLAPTLENASIPQDTDIERELRALLTEAT
ncbi:MAG: alpha-ketoacid dehydrogenase subunit beta [Bdellovibrionales bacterium]|nr:alpha-ketoacid dehydrogenase subunit beta [Bdellovibrionales bacterium]